MELTAFETGLGRKVYLKSEADAYIKGLEEKHKMEVEQLLYEISRLKLLNKTYFQSSQLAVDLSIRHQKYNRCLAMAGWCQAGLEMLFSMWNSNELGLLSSIWEFKIEHHKKWRRRWLQLAELNHVINQYKPL